MVAGCGGHGDTRGSASETGGASSSGKKNKSQAWEGTKEKFLNITSEDLWSPQKILSPFKGQPESDVQEKFGGECKSL